MAKTTPKSKAWTACSRYCRLRDALAYCEKYGINTGQFTRPEDIVGKCCTCGAVKSWIRMHGGHFISRASAGLSGVYFDERNVNLQCAQCNAFAQGAYAEYQKFMVEKYGQEVIDDLWKKHYIVPDFKDLAMLAMERYYKERYEDLTK